MSPQPTDKKQSGIARVLGSASAGICEIAVFHPVDTVSKRLMSNQTKITSAGQLNSVIFREHAQKALGGRLLTLFPGLGYAAVYKILQRVY